MRRPNWLSFAFGLSVIASPADAQRVGVRPSFGTRIRVAAPPREGWITGALVDADSARFVLRDTRRASHDTVLIEAIQNMQVSNGYRRGERAIVFAVCGGIVGGAVAALFAHQDASGSDSYDLVVGAAAVGGFAGGAVLGGAIGALTATERWRTVPPPE